jgi:DNA polymerase III alpha subunit
VAYGFISYWCCVLKAHSPLEFAAATLSHMDDSDKQLRMLREMVREGYEYCPVDIELSTDKWQSANGKLIGPLNNVKGLGPKMLAEVLEARMNGQPIPKRATKLLTDPVTPIDDLFPVAKRTAELCPEGLEALNILTTPTPIIDCQTETMGGKTVLVIARINDINPRDLNEPQLVQKRGGRLIDADKSGFLNLIVEDDTDQIRATVWSRQWESAAKPIMERGDAGNVLYAIKGKIGHDFRAIEIERIKFLGTMK